MNLNFNVGNMKDFNPNVNPVFNFKGFQVRILASVPWNVYLSLCALCTSYKTCGSIADPVGRFVRFVSVELHYPIQVLPVLSECFNED